MQGASIVVNTVITSMELFYRGTYLEVGLKMKEPRITWEATQTMMKDMGITEFSSFIGGLGSDILPYRFFDGSPLTNDDRHERYYPEVRMEVAEVIHDFSSPILGNKNTGMAHLNGQTYTATTFHKDRAKARGFLNTESAPAHDRAMSSGRSKGCNEGPISIAAIYGMGDFIYHNLPEIVKNENNIAFDGRMVFGIRPDLTAVDLHLPTGVFRLERG